jgi:hypothetical protein
MYVKCDSVLLEQPLKEGENSAVFILPEGQYKMDIWVQEKGKAYTPRPDEDLTGDCIVNYLITD